MRRLVLLFVLLLCSAFVDVPNGVAIAEQSRDVAPSSREHCEWSIAEISMPDDDGNSAERVVPVTVSVINSVTTLTRSFSMRSDYLPSTIQAVASGLHYIVGFFPYRLGCRAVDYYLYTLCRLRL
jgi:hypothetical protein